MGSYGKAFLNWFIKTDIAEICIFFRDEKMQDDMRHEYQAKMPDVAHKIKFYTINEMTLPDLNLTSIDFTVSPGNDGVSTREPLFDKLIKKVLTYVSQ